MAPRTLPPSLILNLSLQKYLLLNIVTGGLYFYVLQWRLNGVFAYLNLPLKTQAMKNSVIAMWSSLGMCLVMATLVHVYPNEIRLILAVLGFLMFFILMQIVWAFQCRSALKQFCQREALDGTVPNPLLTLLIPGIVLIRSINRLRVEST